MGLLRGQRVKVVGRNYKIQFQSRPLPHVHFMCQSSTYFFLLDLLKNFSFACVHNNNNNDNRHSNKLSMLTRTGFANHGSYQQDNYDFSMFGGFTFCQSSMIWYAC